jgi:MoaA/NifB/PqqE/SkfB family radical SAM enzyme
MQTILWLKTKNLDRKATSLLQSRVLRPSIQRVPYLERAVIWWAIKSRIFYFACVILRKPAVIRRIFKKMLSLRNSVWGGDLKKMYKVEGRYYFNLYTPGWPSKAYDDLIKAELKRQASPMVEREKLSFIFLAITRKCPLRCEHCFEWDNLNKKESFTKEDLYKVIDLYQKEGVLQIHFSGGEPMVRIRDLIDLVQYASVQSACWVITSGFNFTASNAWLLRTAGCTGVVVSIDHYIPELHNLFRGKEDAFQNAINAIVYAKRYGLVTSLSVCATKTFLDGGHLGPYMDFAKSLGVQFVQVLEPRQVGHYADKDVLLDEHHITLLEQTFTKMNHAPEYSNHPTLLYHGYHQRRVGCFSGSRSVYIDSAGDVHACPFCHTKSYNIISLIRANETVLPEKENKCPLFEKIA